MMGNLCSNVLLFFCLFPNTFVDWIYILGILLKLSACKKFCIIKKGLLPSLEAPTPLVWHSCLYTQPYKSKHFHLLQYQGGCLEESQFTLPSCLLP